MARTTYVPKPTMARQMTPEAMAKRLASDRVRKMISAVELTVAMHHVPPVGL